MRDCFNREITYLRVSVTDRCNLRCSYCMPASGVTKQKHSDILRYEQIVDIVRHAVAMGIEKIRLTGGEPTARLGIVQLVQRIREIPGVRELAMTTNGVLLSQMAKPLKAAGLDRLNISLDSLNPDKYRRMTRLGNISAVLAGIDATIEAGFTNTKVNMVLISGVNDDEIPAFAEFCLTKKISLQRIKHYSLSSLASLNHEFPAERPLDCHLCNRIRLTADGKLKPCLFSDIEIPVNFQDITASLRQAIAVKPEKGTGCANRSNSQIGG